MSDLKPWVRRSMVDQAHRMHDLLAQLYDRAEALGFATVADRASLTRDDLKNLLRYDGNPTLRQLQKIVVAVDMELRYDLTDRRGHDDMG